MKIINTLTTPVKIANPVVLSIGNFDGVHLGHRAVLSHMDRIACTHNTQRAVVTFSNHPSEVLRPSNPTLRLCSPEHKMHLLECAKVDFLISLPFTKELSQQSAHKFLQDVFNCIPFSHLVLGYDATFGKDKQGDRTMVQQIAKTLQFNVEYIEPMMLDGLPVSSSAIRACIKQGNFAQVSKML